MTPDCADWLLTGDCQITGSSLDALLSFSLFFGVDGLFSLLVDSAAFSVLPIERKIDVAVASAEQGFDITRIVNCLCGDIGQIRLTPAVVRRMSPLVALHLVREHSAVLGYNSVMTIGVYLGKRVVEGCIFPLFCGALKCLDHSSNVNILRSRFDLCGVSGLRAVVYPYVPDRPFEGVLHAAILGFKMVRATSVCLRVELPVVLRVSQYCVRFADAERQAVPIVLCAIALEKTVVLDSRRVHTEGVQVVDVVGAEFFDKFALICPVTIDEFEFFGDLQQSPKKVLGVRRTTCERPAKAGCITPPGDLPPLNRKSRLFFDELMTNLAAVAELPSTIDNAGMLLIDRTEDALTQLAEVTREAMHALFEEVLNGTVVEESTVHLTKWEGFRVWLLATRDGLMKHAHSR
jgi:hypothetical protein